MWRARSIFISSTFEDFQSERDHLRNHVFPELEERLRQRRRHLEWVDLRVGVPTHDASDPTQRELDILKVCLAEVDRCRPFLLVLLGERYGWIPDTDRVRIAAQEAGLNLDTPACSITELEILAGAFAHTTARALFYIREPLDYRRMPTKIAALYSSKHNGDRAGDKRLEALKRRIEDKFGSRVRRYRATWDEQRQRTSGLDSWGRAVLEDLWRELAADAGPETAAARSARDPEREALEEFIEDRARDLVGREPLVSQLARLALDRTSSAGACVIGDPGSGKSALFGAIARKLAGSDAVVLMHAAGASPTASSVNAMLRRWMGELAETTPPPQASNSSLHSAFAEALARAAARRRVVLLIDALDQFESTLVARQFAWLPPTLPANVRLIVFATQGDAGRAASARPGLTTFELKPLGSGDARALIKAISARYHRVLDPAVVSALADKQVGTPLWLVLAAETINLVDADDLARAKRHYSGGPAERLRAMMVDTAKALPDDVAGLYNDTFAHAEKVFGAPLVGAFLAMIAVSRGGWREHDFSRVIPRLSGENWDSLRFASLRRLFRGQMRQRGPLQQWDFAHAQMRAAALARLDAPSRKRVHAAIADHLLALPSEDPLRIGEVMTHLLASEDWPRAARVVGDFENPALLDAASQTVMEAILAAPDSEWANRLPAATRVMDVVNEHDRYRAIQVFQYEVLDRLAFRDALALPRRLRLQEKVRDGFRALRKDILGPPFEDDIRWYSHVSAADGRIAETYLKMGDIAAAEPLMREAVRIGRELTRIDADYAEWNRDLSVAYNKLGQLLRGKGDLAGAMDAFKSGLKELQTAIRKEPQPQWQRDVAISERLIADMEMRVGDPKAALAASERAGEITERLAHEQPDNMQLQIDLAHEYENRSDRLLVEGLLAEAERYCRSAVEIRERVCRLDPHDGRNRRSLARAWRKLGDILSFRNAEAGAADALRIALLHASDLAASDPSNTEWTSDAASVRIDYARKLAILGQTSEAQTELRIAEADLDRLLKITSTRPDWIEYKAQAQSCAAEIHERREDLGAAEAALRAAVDTRRHRLRLDGGREAQQALADALVKLGDLLWLLRDLAPMERVFGEALSILEVLAREDPRNINAAQAAASILGRLGQIKGAMALHREALSLFQSSRAKLEMTAAAAPEFIGVRKNLAAITFNIGYAYFSLGENAEAAEWQRRAIAILEPIASDERDRAQLASWGSQLFETENLLANVGDPVEQEARCRQRLNVLETRYGATPRNSAQRTELLALYEALRDIQARRGDLEGAQQSYQAIKRLGGAGEIKGGSP